MTFNKILCLTIFLINSFSIQAQKSFTPLFESIISSQKNNLSLSKDIKRQYVCQLNQIDKASQPRIGKQVQFNLFNDIQINADLEQLDQPFHNNMEVYVGRTEDARFDHLPHYRDVVIVINPNTKKMTAVVENNQGTFEISPIMGTNNYKISEMSKEPIDCELHFSDDEETSIPAAEKMTDCTETDENGVYVTDLFVGYSDQAAAVVGDLDAHAMTLVQVVNNGLTNSLVDDVYMRLVGTGTNPENPGVVTSVLSDVYDWYEDELIETGADFVASIQVLTGASGEAGGWAGIGGYSSVNRASSAVNVFRHEMGHNMGGGHCVGDYGIEDYAHGHNNGNSGHRTHLCGNDLNFYSNPDVLDEQGTPLGDATHADMARVWSERAEEIANHEWHRIPFFDGDDCNTQYCPPVHICCDNESITNVNLADIDNSSLHGTSTEHTNYSDFTDVSTDLTIAETYAMTITPNFSYNDSKVGIWIDWNQDGIFQVSDSIQTFSGKGPWSFSFVPPSDATLGSTRMRIRLQYGPNTIPHPCNSSGYNGGESEDYSVNILAPNCTEVVVDENGFENGYKIWNDGGIDCRKNANDAAYATTGTYCVRLRDNDVSSVMTSDALDLEDFEEITVDFGYYVRSFENTEDFFLEISTDGGSNFSIAEEWNRGDEFNNDEFKTGQVTIEGPFSATTVLRFRCDASGNADWVYLDDVKITGCTNNPPSNLLSNGDNPYLTTVDLIENITIENINIDSPEVEVLDTPLSIFPNPFTDNLTIKTVANEWFLFNAFGKLIKKGNANPNESTLVDLSELPSGIYFVKTGRETGKVIKQ